MRPPLPQTQGRTSERPRGRAADDATDASLRGDVPGHVAHGVDAGSAGLISGSSGIHPSARQWRACQRPRRWSHCAGTDAERGAAGAARVHGQSGEARRRPTATRCAADCETGSGEVYAEGTVFMLSFFRCHTVPPLFREQTWPRGPVPYRSGAAYSCTHRRAIQALCAQILGQACCRP